MSSDRPFRVIQDPDGTLIVSGSCQILNELKKRFANKFAEQCDRPSDDSAEWSTIHFKRPDIERSKKAEPIQIVVSPHSAPHAAAPPPPRPPPRSISPPSPSPSPPPPEEPAPDIFAVFGFKPIQGIAKYFEIRIPPAEASRVFSLFPNGKPYTARYRSDLTKAEEVLMFKHVGNCVHVKDSSRFSPEELRHAALSILNLKLPSPATGRALKRVLRFLSLCLEIPPTDLDAVNPGDYPELRGDLIGRNFPQPPLSQFTQCELFVHLYHAALLVELFATNQTEQELHFLMSKSFLTKPHVYTLALPVDLPVLVSYAPERQSAAFRFADLAGLPAAEVRAQVDLALRIFGTLRLVSSRMINIDYSALPVDAWNRLAASAGALIITGVEQRLSSLTVGILALPEGPGDNARNKIRKACEKLFAPLQMWRCSVCQLIITERFDRICVHAFHPGERIPYPNGKWTRAGEEDGESVEYEQWTCCRENIVGLPGCEEVVTNGHSRLEDSQVLSQFEFAVLA